MADPFFSPHENIRSRDVNLATGERELSAQSPSVKIQILFNTCAVQAHEAERAGRFVDADEWRELADRVGRLE